jgi:hypothetical protein
VALAEKLLDVNESRLNSYGQMTGEHSGYAISCGCAQQPRNYARIKTQAEATCTILTYGLERLDSFGVWRVTLR